MFFGSFYLILFSAKIDQALSDRPSPHPSASPARARPGPGWQAPLVALWRELALLRGAGRRDRRGATRSAEEALHAARTRLEALLEPGRPRGRSDFERCLGCAAGALEGCVHVGVAHATSARRGHLHLLRRLEQRLAEAERAVLRADADYQVRSEQLTAAAERGALALQELAGPSDDPSPAELENGLETLEDASLELAMLAIRAALNVGAGHDPGGESDPPRELVTRLDAQIDTLAETAKATRARARGAGRQASASGWLADALATELPAGAARGTRLAGRELLADLRGAWLRLAGFELLLVEELDQAAPDPPLQRPRRDPRDAHPDRGPACAPHPRFRAPPPLRSPRRLVPPARGSRGRRRGARPRPPAARRHSTHCRGHRLQRPRALRGCALDHRRQLHAITHDPAKERQK